MAKRKAARKTAARTSAGRKSTGGRGRTSTARKTARRTSARTTGAAKASGRTRSARKGSRTATKKSAAKRTAARKAARKSTARKTATTRKAMAARRDGRTAARTGASRAAAAPGATSTRRALRPARPRPEEDTLVPTPPSSLDLDRTASAVRTGRRGLRNRFDEHTETGPAVTGGDVDADWESAYSVGDEAPGGDNPTPDQDIVEDIGRAVGVQYEDNEELKGDEKVASRDKHRWELDPASSEDYEDR